MRIGYDASRRTMRSVVSFLLFFFLQVILFFFTRCSSYKAIMIYMLLAMQIELLTSLIAKMLCRCAVQITKLSFSTFCLSYHDFLIQDTRVERCKEYRLLFFWEQSATRKPITTSEIGLETTAIVVGRPTMDTFKPNGQQEMVLKRFVCIYKLKNL